MAVYNFDNLKIQQTTLSDRVGQYKLKYRTWEKVAEVTGIDKAYLVRMWNGEKINPSQAVLDALELKKVVQYFEITYDEEKIQKQYDRIRARKQGEIK